MTFILDTHVLLWFITGDAKLKPAMLALINDPQNRRLLSIISVWEIVIKASLGKLPIKGPIAEFLRKHVMGNDIHILPLALEHFDSLEILPHHHGDPFDRLIAAQALEENLPLMSADAAFDAYAIQRIW